MKIRYQIGMERILQKDLDVIGRIKITKTYHDFQLKKKCLILLKLFIELELFDINYLR
jgi:hypothetical protein